MGNRPYRPPTRPYVVLELFSFICILGFMGLVIFLALWCNG